MRTLTLKDVEAGMQLAEPVRTLQGFELARAGVAITHKHLKAFKAWGVTEVKVDSDEIHEAQQHAAPPSSQDVEMEVRRRFQKNNEDNDVIKELIRIAIQRRMSAQGGPDGRSAHVAA